MRSTEERCENCGRFRRIRGQRYCSPCKARVLRKMFESGYLSPGPVEQSYRGEEALPGLREPMISGRVHNAPSKASGAYRPRECPWC